MNDIDSLLRAHDPAAGKVLTSFDRTRTLAAAREGARLTRPRLAAAVAMLVIALVAVMITHRRAQPEPRQIQYATPGGTRIIWTLDPQFHM
jgi:hypothetical protein